MYNAFYTMYFKGRFVSTKDVFKDEKKKMVLDNLVNGFHSHNQIAFMNICSF